MKNRITYGAGASLFKLVALILTNFIQTMLVVRFLPKDLAGLFFVFISVSMYLNFFDFGISPTLSRLLAFEMGTSNPTSLALQRLLRNARGLFYGLSLLTFLICELLGALYFHYLKIPSQQWLSLYWSFSIFVLGLSLQLFGNNFNATLYGTGFVHYDQGLRGLSAILLIVLTVLLAPFGILGFCLAYLIRACLMLLISYRTVVKCIAWTKPLGFMRASWHLPTLKQLIHPASKWTLMELGGLFLFQSSNIIISLELSPQAVTEYAPLVQLMTAILFFGQTIPKLYSPLISTAYAAQEFLTIIKAQSVILRSGNAIIISSIAYVLFFSHPIMTTWLGPHYAWSDTVLLLLAVIAFFETQQISYATTALACNYLNFAFVSISAGILNIILSIVLIKALGIAGAALSLLISQGLTSFWFSIWATYRHLHWRPTLFTSVYLRSLIYLPLVVLQDGAIRALLKHWHLSPTESLISSFFTLALTNVVSIWFVLLSSGERTTVLKKIGL